MAHPTRILFVAGEVEPFAKVSEAATLVRQLPEQLQETGDFEARIMMPRYGTISERKNRLHEVIRLSGTDIPMGEETETLKVKVASIPGIRLQVYFMDNSHFFKRKGVHTDRQGALFGDNAERALFFGRSVIETLRKLRWGPDVIHCVGWISGFVPMLLQTEYADDELFAETKIIYTPDGVEADARVTAELVEAMQLHVNGEVTGLDVADVGLKFAHAAAPLHADADADGTALHLGETETLTQQAIALYDQTQAGVLA